MEAGKQNLIVNKKASFRFDFYVYDTFISAGNAGNVPRDLTGATISAKAKAKITDSVNLFTFTTSLPTPAAGHCRLELTAAQTSAMAWDKGVWDVFVTFPDVGGYIEVVKYLEGNLVLDKSAS